MTTNLTPEQAEAAVSIKAEIADLTKKIDDAKNRLNDCMASLVPYKVGDIVEDRQKTTLSITRVSCYLWANDDPPRVYSEFYGSRATKSGWHTRETYIGNELSLTKKETVEP